MPKFAANLHYLFTEDAFLDRFRAAAAAGFRAVEFQVPYEYPGAQLRTALREHELQMVLFDTPMGDWSAGDRGLAAIPGREAEFRAGLPKAAEYAQALDCDLVHVMAGVPHSGADVANAERVYIDNLRYAAAFFKRHGVKAVIEPINRQHGQVRGGPSYTTEGMRAGWAANTVPKPGRLPDWSGARAMASVLLRESERALGSGAGCIGLSFKPLRRASRLSA